MKDQHGNKITEYEFTKDIGHGTEGGALELAKNNSNGLELSEMFGEYEGRAVNNWRAIGTTEEFIANRKCMQEIFLQITKQIQSDLLKEILEKLNYWKTDNDKESQLVDDIYLGIKKLAEEKGILIK